MIVWADQIAHAIRPYFSDGAHGNLKAEHAARAVLPLIVEARREGVEQGRREGRDRSWKAAKTPHVWPSGTTFDVEGDITQSMMMLDLGDLRRVIDQGMTPGGWAEHFQEDLRALFAVAERERLRAAINELPRWGGPYGAQQADPSGVFVRRDLVLALLAEDAS